MQRIGIVTPIYATPENRRLELFHNTLSSVVGQSYPHFLYVVVDDDSTSDVKGYLGCFNDRRILYVKRKRSPTDLKTASNALNLGIDLCLERDDLCAVTFLHSDDLLAEDSLRSRLKNLGNGFVHTDMALFTKKGNIIGVRRWRGSNRGYESEFKKYPIDNHHTIMWTIEFLRYLKSFVARNYRQQGIFDPLLSHIEDRDISLSSIEAALEGGFEIYYVPVVSVFYRYHQQSITGDPTDTKVRKAQGRRFSRKHFGEFQPKSSILDLFERLKLDPPWSWGTWFPERVKRSLRPIRDNIRGFTFNLYHQDIASGLRNYVQQLEKAKLISG